MLNILRSPRVFALLATAATGLTALLGGCVNQGEYDRLYETNRTLTDRNAILQRERDEALAARDRTAEQLRRTEEALAALQAQNKDLLDRLRQAGIDVQDLTNRIAQLGVSPLEPELDAALRDLVNKFPDQLEYDERLGMIRFKSDVLFDSGSDAIRPEARPALSALAQILRSDAARPYDVIILGHTDSQRISANTARRFPTNVHLSVGRSISVRSSLVDSGVEPGKMQVAGWGEFRPRVPNRPPTGNTAENRRVEFYLTRPRVPAGELGSGGTIQPAADSGAGRVNADQSAPPTRGPDITK